MKTVAGRRPVLFALIAIACAIPAQGQVNQAWVAYYDGGEREEAVDVVVASTGAVFVTGPAQGFPPPAIDAVTVRYEADGSPTWTARFDAAGQEDSPSALAPTPDGGVVVVGSSHRSTSFYDYFTVRYDGAGAELWRAYLDGAQSTYDVAVDVAVDGAGNVFVVGDTRGLRSFDVTLVKYDPLGNELWRRTYDGPARLDDHSAALAFDDQGRIAVVGTSFTSSGDHGCLTLQYDAAGTLLWSAHRDPPAGRSAEGRAVALDPLGNVWVTGSLDPGLAPETDFVTIRYGPDGSEHWAAFYDGPLGHGPDVPEAIAVDRFGNAHVTGWSAYQDAGTSSFYVGAATLKYDGAGQLLWARRLDTTLGGAFNVRPRDLALDAGGGVYVVGQARSGSTVFTPAELFALKYDAAGAFAWQMAFTSPNPCGLWEDGANALALDAAGSVYMAGVSRGPGTCPGVTNDFVTIKYEPTCGVPLTYCTAKTGSSGCTPSIALTGIPSASAGSGCTLTTSSLIGQTIGLYLHSTAGEQSVPFHGGWLCVRPPLRRHPPRITSGAPGTCDGVLSEDLNAYIASGVDPKLVPGASVWLQAWARAPADPFGDSLSDALRVTLCP